MHGSRFLLPPVSLGLISAVRCLTAVCVPTVANRYRKVTATPSTPKNKCGFEDDKKPEEISKSVVDFYVSSRQLSFNYLVIRINDLWAMRIITAIDVRGKCTDFGTGRGVWEVEGV